MKNLFTILIISIIALAAAPPAAHAADTFQPNYYVQDTNSATAIAFSNAQARTLSGKKFTVRQGKGLSEFVQVISTNSTATTFTLGHDVGLDGTNASTTHPINFKVPAGAIGTNTYWTNYPASYLSNVRTIQATYGTNDTAGALTSSNTVLVKWWYSQDNQ